MDRRQEEAWQGRGGVPNRRPPLATPGDEDVYYDNHREQNDERKPLTPRDSLTPAELLEMRTASSYLAYFRSPTTKTSQTPQHAVSAERSLKTPPAWSNVASRRVPTPYVREEDSEDDEDSSQASTSTPGDSYVPTRYTSSTTPQSQHTPFNVPRTRMSLGAESRRSVASVGSSEGDARSVASSNLFGESFVSLDSESPRNRRITIDTGLSHVMGGPSTELEDGEKAKRLQLKMVRSYHNFMHNLQSWSEVVRQHWSARHQTALPLSPRSKNLADIHFLENQHRLKMKDLVVDDSEQGFDFCLILQPQEVYSYWADLLDFRTELLGQEMTQAVEDHWEMSMREKKTKGGFGTDDKENDIEGGNSSVATCAKKHGEETSPSASSSMDESEARDFATAMRTPRPPLSSRLSHLVSKRWLSTPEQTAASPSMYSFSDSTSRFSAAPSTVRQPSMFERALGPLASEELADTELTDMNTTVAATPGSIAVSTVTNPHTVVRRKWGNQATQQALQRSSMMSPPVHSLTPAVRRRPLVNRLPPIVPESELSSTSEREEPKEKNPHEIAMEDIPNRKIPRGIAIRTRGLSAFLPAVRRGIVMRKHRPCQEPSFCKIVSTDGGDTIQVHSLTPRQAYPLLREQRRLYNPSEEKALAAADWSLEPEEDQNAAPADRHLAVRHFTRVVRRGTFRTADVVAVHPARREDPRSVAGDKGSLTLRRSRSDYDSNRTFSLVLRSNPAFVRSNGPSDIEEYEIRWATGEGTESQFRYFDFEAATEGEYWLVSRGFVLLQRDAAVGRFAEHRSAGISSHYCRLMGELKQQVAQEFQVHEDDFHEPVTVSFLERRIVEWRGLDMGYMKGFTAPGALPPPSDYFLGFKAPGTAIWSRLRNAGLDVQRVYSLDRRKVILKISCPSYRLMDVAEVLRVKLKTWDGSFASFRQDLIDLYQPLNDPLEGGDTSAGSFDYVFASSVRQQIIDFIIRSRIRDSGAEIGQATVKRPSGLDSLGKMIQARVPLHMHGKLEAVFHAWAFYWRLENWTENRDGKSMSHLGIMLDKQEKEMLQGDLPLASSTSDSSDAESLEAAAADSSPQHSRSSSRSGWSKALPPPFWRRFFVGAFFQPLDSIEDYFGEKVAFYFAWLQHTATHLVFLSIAGLILFCCQISSNNFDHPLRPVFALMVMLWTFVVLVNWKKRANFLAYRWGTMSYKEQETTRPQYRGDFEEDEITGEDVVRYPKWKRWTKYAISFPVTLLFTGGTLIMILWVHANRDLQLARYLEQKRNPDAPDFKLQFDFRAIGSGIKATNIELTRENLLDPTFWFITIGMPAMLGLCLPLLNFMLSKLSIVSFLRFIFFSVGHSLTSLF
jgi:hypothetical protein